MRVRKAAQRAVEAAERGTERAALPSRALDAMQRDAGRERDHPHCLARVLARDVAPVNVTARPVAHQPRHRQRRVGLDHLQLRERLELRHARLLGRMRELQHVRRAVRRVDAEILVAFARQRARRADDPERVGRQRLRFVDADARRCDGKQRVVPERAGGGIMHRRLLPAGMRPRRSMNRPSRASCSPSLVVWMSSEL